MEVTGKIIVDLGEQSGTSRAGNAWVKHEYVLETQESYPKKVHFDLFGDKARQYPLSIGDEVVLSFDINSREYNGRWYTSISGWKVEKAGAQAPAAPQGYDFPTAPGAVPPPPAPADLGSGATDNLPF